MASRTLFFVGGSVAAKRLRSFLVLALLWGFAALTGFGPPVVRAAVMITVHELSRMRCARSDSLVALSVAALLILLGNPESLRTVGFQLSFAACLGIVLLYPLLRGLLAARTRFLEAVWNTMALSLSCQAATGLISWFYFRRFPRFFLLANLFGIPLAGLALHLLFPVLLSTGMPFFHLPMKKILECTIGLLNAMAAILSRLSPS